jgi:hypothetical protein
MKKIDEIYCVSSSAGQTIKVAEACNWEVIADEGSDIILPKNHSNMSHFQNGTIHRVIMKKTEVSCDEFCEIVKLGN